MRQTYNYHVSDSRLYGGVEGGGTKFACLIGSDPDQILEKTVIPTTTPEATLDQVIRFFRPHVDAGRIRCIGIASFGPVDLNRDSPHYGSITSTPKPGWSHTPVLGILQEGLRTRFVFNMDVNAAAYGEYLWGANRGVDPSLYITIGTGIGGGYIKDGQPLTGLMNLEMGHLRLPHDPNLDPFPGACPYHGDCFEGLASGPAIQKRFGRRGENLSDDDPFWNLEANYIALALHNLIVTLSPKRLVLGGGVMHRLTLFPALREKVLRSIYGYVQSPVILEKMDEYIIPPSLGDQSGSLGALALAMQSETKA